jgi:hypothetical protein
MQKFQVQVSDRFLQVSSRQNQQVKVPLPLQTGFTGETCGGQQRVAICPMGCDSIFVGNTCGKLRGGTAGLADAPRN